ncbi:fibronectin type III domain-containing protein [Aeromicrobium sp. UC242_57]|uniref:fibronectin type III domain-containing protein n=1 Tax=Aeromicrobium sp. UC242_57 TaxID=3374624 RepID=UPI0037B10C4B
MTSRTDSARARRGAPLLRLSLLTAAVVALIGTGLQPATAASKPGQVGLVTFTGKSFARSSQTASLSFSWPKAKRAKKYEVYISRNYSMSRAKKFTTGHRTKTVKGLVPGADYFVRIRAVNGSKRGTYSQRVGHTTIRQLASAQGPTYRVMLTTCARGCVPSGPPDRPPRSGASGATCLTSWLRKKQTSWTFRPATSWPTTRVARG